LFYHKEHKAGTKLAKNFSDSFVDSLRSLWFFFFRRQTRYFHDSWILDDAKLSKKPVCL